MTRINITLEDLFMGNQEKSMAILLEQVINAVLNKEASEQLNAQPYERSDDRLTYRNASSLYNPRIIRFRLLDLKYYRNRIYTNFLDLTHLSYWQRTEKSTTFI